MEAFVPLPQGYIAVIHAGKLPAPTPCDNKCAFSFWFLLLQPGKFGASFFFPQVRDCLRDKLLFYTCRIKNGSYITCVAFLEKTSPV